MNRSLINKYIIDITSEKPRAFCYIDDKAVRFDSWEQALNEISDYETDIDDISKF